MTKWFPNDERIIHELRLAPGRYRCECGREVQAADFAPHGDGGRFVCAGCHRDGLVINCSESTTI
jgi:hypothetical protein